MNLTIVKGFDEIYIDTDLILNGFAGSLKIKNKFTGFINAAEILSRSDDKSEKENLKNLFQDVNILGFPFRYSETLASMINSFSNKISLREMIIGTLLIETRLPLLTDNINLYKILSENFQIKIIDSNNL